MNAKVYVDWLDNTMPIMTSGKTGTIIKERIEKLDKFILVASDAAIESKWCNWELGYGDAKKYAAGKIALFPISKVDGAWKGSEYMQMYPTIQYYDGSQRYSNMHEVITEGYYYRYLGHNGRFCLKKLSEWLME